MTFGAAFALLAKHANENARNKGFYEDHDEIRAVLNPRQQAYFDHLMMGTRLALIHSEVSEALENDRHDSPPDDKVPEFTGVEAELADVLIRIMDLAHEKKLRVAEAVIAKMAYNSGRPYKHGKTH